MILNTTVLGKYMAGNDVMLEKLERIADEILRLLHIRLSEQTLHSLVQFGLFCMIGVSNAVISYGLNVAVLLLLKSAQVPWDYIAGNLVAFFLSVLWSFFWNSRMVFAQEKAASRSVWKTLIKTYIAYGFTGILLNNLLSWLWIDVFGISKYIAPLINILISTPINFFLNKLWAFSEKKRAE